MNESLQIVGQMLEFAERILTQPRNIIKNSWVERWLREEGSIDTERFLEVMNWQTKVPHIRLDSPIT